MRQRRINAAPHFSAETGDQGGCRCAYNNLAGYRLQDTPEWQYMLGTNYEFPIFRGMGTFRAQYSYTGELSLQSSNLQNTKPALLKSRGLLDLSLNYAPDGGKWSVNVWARNATNKHYFTSMFDALGVLQAGSYGDPRTIGATVKYDF